MKFENIYLKIHPGTDRLSTEYRYDDEYMQFYRRVRLDILGKLRNNDAKYNELKKIHLGFLEGTFLHMNRISQNLGDNDAWTVFDHLGGAIEHLGNVILESEQIYANIVGRNQNIFFIDAIYIHNSYQRKGIGTRIISELEASLLWIFDYKIGSLILNPELCTQQIEGNRSVSYNEDFLGTMPRQMASFFKNLGFMPIAKESSFLYLNTDFEMMYEEAYEDVYDFDYDY